ASRPIPSSPPGRQVVYARCSFAALLLQTLDSRGQVGRLNRPALGLQYGSYRLRFVGGDFACAHRVSNLAVALAQAAALAPTTSIADALAVNVARPQMAGKPFASLAHFTSAWLPGMNSPIVTACERIQKRHQAYCAVRRIT